MSMTPVTVPQFNAQAQANISAFLSAFFDGGSHNVGTQSYTFPAALIKFGRQQVPRGLRQPWIIIEPTTGAAADRMWAGAQKTKVRRDSHWRFIVATSNPDVGGASDWKSNDQVSDLLTLLLENARPTLAAGGMRIISTGSARKDYSDPERQFTIIPCVIRSEMQTLTGP